jgi:hypothetical protein
VLLSLDGARSDRNAFVAILMLMVRAHEGHLRILAARRARHNTRVDPADRR